MKIMSSTENHDDNRNEGEDEISSCPSRPETVQRHLALNANNFTSSSASSCVPKDAASELPTPSVYPHEDIVNHVGDEYPMRKRLKVEPIPLSRAPTNAVQRGGGNADEEDQLEEEEEEESDEDELVTIQQMLAASGGRIPLEFLTQLRRLHQLGGNDDDSDEEQPQLPYRPPQTLADVARFIQSDACQNIIILAGAGMSVASGIPDFRSPNGLYATLQADLLTCDNEAQQDRIQADPSYALDQHLFLENPLPCLEVNREFVLGVYEQRWKATLAHRFVELLHAKTGKLCRLYTQNIDGLEDQCHLLPHSKRIAVHGSMDEACCAKCGTIMPMDQFCHEMRTKIKDWTKGIQTSQESNEDDNESGSSSSSSVAATAGGAGAPLTSSHIYCGACGAPAVKPNIVLFRSPLPPQFFECSMTDTESADLLIVLGTSLGVAPANSLVWRVPPTCMRVVLNRESVGWHLGFDPRRHERDLFARGNCEDLCLELCKEMGWLSDLRQLVADEVGPSHLPESSQVLLQAALDQADQKVSPLHHDEDFDASGESLGERSVEQHE
jgi:NAD+-dependent protein deacetylase sirtuin 2